MRYSDSVGEGKTAVVRMNVKSNEVARLETELWRLSTMDAPI
jgi:hypothetical protein